MASLYVFEGIDERKQLEKFEALSNAGIHVELHYHVAWNTFEGPQWRKRVECNERCIAFTDATGKYKIEGEDISLSRIPGLQDK